MRTIWYLINLSERLLVETYEGQGDEIPAAAKAKATKLAESGAGTCLLARGQVFFQVKRA